MFEALSIIEENQAAQTAPEGSNFDPSVDP